MIKSVLNLHCSTRTIVRLLIIIKIIRAKSNVKTCFSSYVRTSKEKYVMVNQQLNNLFIIVKSYGQI